MKQQAIYCIVLVFALVSNCAENNFARTALNKVINNKNSLSICPQIVNETFSILTKRYEVSPNNAGKWLIEVMNREVIDFLEPGLQETRLAIEMASHRKIKGSDFFDVCLAAVVISFELDGILTDNTKDFSTLGVNIIPMRETA